MTNEATQGPMDLPVMPRKKAAVFHHPTLDIPMYDSLAMDLHAMTYAEPLIAEVHRLRLVLQVIATAAQTSPAARRIAVDALAA